MADKKVPLAIVISTVDKATAGINAINKRLDAITKPTRDFKKSLGELGDKSGFNSVVDGFKGVGGAIEGLIGKVAVVGGVVAIAVHAVIGLVDEFDNLGDTAEKLQVNVDFLAAMRFAAERSGASVESLDQGLTGFGASMGQLRGGSGKMLKSLQQWAPGLIPMLKATKGNEAAFRLLADAMEKITDPQKRLAFARATVGDTALVPMLARGSKGLLELQGEFAATAGSLDEAATAAGATDDALKNLKAAGMGVKASIVTGLAPALTIVIDKLKVWFVDHREDVRRWALEIGDKLPGAVDNIVKSVTGAVGWVTRFVDTIGGAKVALLAIGAVMVGPMIASIATLSAALVTTPFGWVLLSLATITAAVMTLIGAFKELEDFFDKMDTRNERGLQDLSEFQTKFGMKEGARRWRAAHPEIVEGAEKNIRLFRESHPGAPDPNDPMTAIMDAHNAQLAADSFIPPDASGLFSGMHFAAENKITVEFKDAPKGMRATADPKNTTDIDLTVGHQLLGAP